MVYYLLIHKIKKMSLEDIPFAEKAELLAPTNLFGDVPLTPKELEEQERERIRLGIESRQKLKAEREAYNVEQLRKKTEKDTFMAAMKAKNWKEVERFVEEVLPSTPSLCDYLHTDYNHWCEEGWMPKWPLYLKLMKACTNPVTPSDLFGAIDFFYADGSKWCVFELILKLHKGSFIQKRIIPMMIIRDAPDEHMVLVRDYGVRYFEDWAGVNETIVFDEFQTRRLARLRQEGVVVGSSYCSPKSHSCSCTIV